MTAQSAQFVILYWKSTWKQSNSASHEDFDVSQILKDFEAYSNN